MSQESLTADEAQLQALADYDNIINEFPHAVDQGYNYIIQVVAAYPHLGRFVLRLFGPPETADIAGYSEFMKIIIKRMDSGFIPASMFEHYFDHCFQRARDDPWGFIEPPTISMETRLPLLPPPNLNPPGMYIPGPHPSREDQEYMTIKDFLAAIRNRTLPV